MITMKEKYNDKNIDVVEAKSYNAQEKEHTFFKFDNKNKVYYTDDNLFENSKVAENFKRLR